MWRRLHTPGLLRYSTLVIAFGVILNHWTYPATMHILQNPNMPPARIESIVKGVMMQMDSAIDFIENQPSFHRLTPAAAKTKEPNTPDFLDSEVADMKDASAKLLCDSNSGQPSKNLHTEH